jgi:hypothetical protein
MWTLYTLLLDIIVEYIYLEDWFRFMVFNATFNNISAILVNLNNPI